jgi:hypothetical protein
VKVEEGKSVESEGTASLLYCVLVTQIISFDAHCFGNITAVLMPDFWLATVIRYCFIFLVQETCAVGNQYQIMKTIKILHLQLIKHWFLYYYLQSPPSLGPAPGPTTETAIIHPTMRSPCLIHPKYFILLPLCV